MSVLKEIYSVMIEHSTDRVDVLSNYSKAQAISAAKIEAAAHLGRASVFICNDDQWLNADGYSCQRAAW